MKNLKFRTVVTAQLGNKAFTNPKGIAKEYARTMLCRCTQIDRIHTWSVSMDNADWKEYRHRTNAYMKRARRRLLPIFTKEMSHE